MTTPAPLVIAEAGVNHNGDPALALRLVDVAAEAGADAVKLQHFHPDRIASPGAGVAAYQARNLGQSPGQRDMLAALRLPPEALAATAAHAAERGLLFLCTPFDEVSADEIRDFVPAWKVSSTDLDNLPFLAMLAETGKPLIVSSGMATLQEVDETVGFLRNKVRAPCGSVFAPLTLLHCISAYPAPLKEVNLRAIPMLTARLGIPVGYSDHTLGIGAAVAATALGAAIIEKHLTLDRSMPGPDHKASLEPAEFAAMTTAIAAAAAALGEAVKAPQPSETESRSSVRRGLYAVHDLPPGHVLKRGDIVALRPAAELPPRLLPDILGRRLARAVTGGRALSAADLAP